MTDNQAMMLGLWAIITITCVVVEISSVNFITIWFALASFICLLCVPFNVAYWIQIIIFVVTSFLTLAIFYPLLKKYLFKLKTVKTNLDLIISKKAVVIKEFISAENNTGLVLIDGKVWTAQGVENGINFEKDEEVIIKTIKGVRLFIEKEGNGK